MLESNIAVRNMLERYLSEGKRIFVYEVVGGFVKIADPIDLDEEAYKEIATIVKKNQFSEKMVQHDSRADVVFATESAVVKYKDKMYLIENKTRDTYIKVYMYYQITPIDIVEIT